MIRKAFVMASLFSAFFVPSIADAGYKVGLTVSIRDFANGVTYAGGDLGAARHSSDRTQYLGCTDSGYSVSCFAKDRNRKYVRCSSRSENAIAVVRGMSDSGYLSFRVVNGECLSVRFTNNSRYAPK